MTKEELEKEAREYLAEHSEYSEVFGQTFVAVDTLTAMLDFAEPREKQIQIDAEQIRALQKQNGELTDELTKKADTNHQLIEQMAKLSEKKAELEAQLSKLKPYRCKNHYQVSETGTRSAVVCYKVYDCENCGRFKEIK